MHICFCVGLILTQHHSQRLCSCSELIFILIPSNISEVLQDSDSLLTWYSVQKEKCNRRPWRDRTKSKLVSLCLFYATSSLSLEHEVFRRSATLDSEVPPDRILREKASSESWSQILGEPALIVLWAPHWVFTSPVLLLSWAACDAIGAGSQQNRLQHQMCWGQTDSDTFHIKVSGHHTLYSNVSQKK